MKHFIISLVVMASVVAIFGAHLNVDKHPIHDAESFEDNNDEALLEKLISEANIQLGNDTQMIGLVLKDMSRILKKAAEGHALMAELDDGVSSYGFWSWLWNGLKAIGRWLVANADVILKIATQVVDAIAQSNSRRYALAEGVTGPEDVVLRLCDDLDRLSEELIQKSRNVPGVVVTNDLGERQRQGMEKFADVFEQQLNY